MNLSPALFSAPLPPNMRAYPSICDAFRLAPTSLCWQVQVRFTAHTPWYRATKAHCALTSYLQTFGQRAEQHQMDQSPQGSRHRGRRCQEAADGGSMQGVLFDHILTSKLRHASPGANKKNNPPHLIIWAHHVLPFCRFLHPNQEMLI